MRDPRAPLPPGLRDEVAPRSGTAVPPTLAALLDTLTRAIDAELGTLCEGVLPLMEELRRGVVALDPPPDQMLPSPKEQEALRAKLVGVLDEAEDILEALRLAARQGGRGSG